MLKKLTKSILVTTSVIAGAALASASPSYAGGATKLISYTPATITKVGANSSGTAYQQTGLMQLSANVDVYIDAGIAAHVKDWKRWLRVRTENSSWVDFSDDGVSESYPILNRPQTVEVLVGMDVAHEILSPLMVSYCNSMADDLRDQGKSNQEIFSQDRSVPVFIQVGKSTNYVGVEGGPLQQIEPPSEINLICKGRPPTPPVHTANDYSPPLVDFKIKDIDLFLTTFSGANTQPNAATTCKKGQVKVRLKTTKAGATKFKLWTKVGAAPATSNVIDAWASFDGNGGFEAEHVEWVSVDKTSTLQAKAEEMISGFGMSTNWEDITLQCTDQSGGGLATNPNTSNPDQPVAPPVTYSGELALADSANVERNQCPRQGQAVFKINSSSSAAVSYSLNCTNGESWQGNVQMFANGPAKFQGVAAKTFSVDKTENVACVLKRVKGNKAYLLTAAAKQYNCVKRVVETGSDDLTDAPKPTSDDQPPSVIADPVREIACVNGRTIGDMCLCARGGRLVKTGARSYRCDKRTPSVIVTPVPAKTVVDPARTDTSSDSAQDARRDREDGRIKVEAERNRREAIAKRLEAAKKKAETERKRKEAIAKHREAAKQAVEAKRKRDAAILKARKLKAAQDAAKKAAAAKRMRDAAIAKRLQAAKRAAAAKRLRDAAAARKRVAPATKRKATSQPALRLRTR